MNLSEWFVVLNLYLTVNEWEEKYACADAVYEKSKTLKDLFLLKIECESRKVYKSKAKLDKTITIT